MKKNSPTKENPHQAAELYALGLEALKAKNSLTALRYFEKAVAIEKIPTYLSHLALCLAKEKRDFAKAVSLCKEAVKYEPHNPDHFLSLGKIHLLAGQKKEAVITFRLGLRTGRNKEITRELDRLGSRKVPLVPFLRRNNPINKYLGIMFTKTGLRSSDMGNGSTK